MFNAVCQRVTTCPVPGVSCNKHNLSLGCYVACIIITKRILWNIQSRLQHLRNINLDTNVDEFGQLSQT